MIIPIGHDRGVMRLPYLTVLIMLICLGLQIYATIKPPEDRAAALRRELVALQRQVWREHGRDYVTLQRPQLLRAVQSARGRFSKMAAHLRMQREVMRDKTAALFGTDKLTAFQDPAAVEKVINRFLARAQIEAGAAAAGPASAALTLLQNASGEASQGLFNLLAARS